MYACPVCGGGTADATHKLNRDGEPVWFVDCFSCRAAGVSGGDYLEALGEETGSAPWELKEEPRPALTPYATGAGRVRSSGGGREAKPSEAELAGWKARLWADGEAFAYLRARGLSEETIRRAGLGYGSFHGRPLAFMFPVVNERGGLLTLKERFWPELWADAAGKEHKSRTLAGRGSYLFPALGSRRRVILCEGEFDALLTEQEFGGRVAAVTSTAGTALPESALEDFAGRTVAVIYDVGAEEQAERNAERLTAAGADAWPVALPLPRQAEDLTDWFATYGRSAVQLRQVLRETRRAA